MECINLSASVMLYVLLFVFCIYLSQADLTTVKLKTLGLSAACYELLFSSPLYWHTVADGQMYVWLLLITVLSL